MQPAVCALMIFIHFLSAERDRHKTSWFRDPSDGERWITTAVIYHLSLIDIALALFFRHSTRYARKKKNMKIVK